jgi:hypothetical protein
MYLRSQRMMDRQDWRQEWARFQELESWRLPQALVGKFIKLWGRGGEAAEILPLTTIATTSLMMRNIILKTWMWLVLAGLILMALISHVPERGSMTRYLPVTTRLMATLLGSGELSQEFNLPLG